MKSGAGLAGYGAPSPHSSSACAALTFPRPQLKSRKGKSRAFRQQKTFLSIGPSAKLPTFPQQQRITAQECESFSPRQLSRLLLSAGVRAASPRRSPRPRPGTYKRFLNRKSGHARTNCASFDPVRSQAPQAPLLQSSVQGVQEVRSGRAGVRALRSVGSGPGTVTELLRNTRNERRQLFPGPPLCPFPATISQKTRPCASPKPPYCSTGVQLHTT